MEEILAIAICNRLTLELLRDYISEQIKSI